ncbi:MAG TPA: DNA helicase PcrA [Clostridiales bacterium]|nr:DNA helicase PcrA [Clostridiales bacterium]
MSISDLLNPEQKRAVLHDKGPLLILAGAGSGKTRVLTQRIAYLIDERGVNPWNILAITFTNKAAREMRERVDNLVGYGSESIWVSTFHSTCVRILRRYIDTIGYSRSFTIYDSDDSKTLMREVCKYLNIDTKKTNEKSILSVISKAKDELIAPEDYERSAGGDRNQNTYARAYTEYQKRLKASNALDFDDLIVKTVELFRLNKEALIYFQNRFQYIMVDEYQDTNTAQFNLIHLLASGVNELGKREYNLCVVGDDDQSIYKFRGANIYNILNFEKAFPGTEVIKLEQNYRSTKNILNAANEVIANNQGRKDKSLWTDNEEGEPVRFIQFDSDFHETDTITADIKRIVDEGEATFNDFAILYRTNAQSRLFEEKLVLRNIPYKIVGGQNFYSRKEIKDILAYLKTIDNSLDSLAVKRIINVPRRGIGLTTIDKVNNYAVNNEISFYEALTRADHIPSLERTSSKITPFVSMIEGLRNRLNSDEYSLSELIDDILDGTGYLREFEEDGSEEALDRIANIDELVNKLVSYEENAEESPTLSSFLEEVSLVADIDNLEEGSDNIVLMTLHSAKGLEFPYVYICGMEEGIFPSYMSLFGDNPIEEVEEERRLCYVGITRAMKALSLTAAKQRMLRGETQFNRPSRFIQEIPRYLLNVTAPGPKTFTPGKKTFQSGGFEDFKFNPFTDKSSSFDKPYLTAEPKNFGSGNLASLDYGVGDDVKHVKFGVGTVTNITQGGKDFEVTVDFPSHGIKKLLSTFANLSKVN